MILHRPARSNGHFRTEGDWDVRSFADAARPGTFDLRKQKDAKRLEAALLELEWPED